MKLVTMIASVLISLHAAVGEASAQWSISGGIEYFSWRESSAPSVTETGPRFAAGLDWTQTKESGWLAAYRGKFYTGRVDYSGTLQLTGAPLSGHTIYNGMVNEIQGIYRTTGSGPSVDYCNWSRAIGEHVVVLSLAMRWELC